MCSFPVIRSPLMHQHAWHEPQGQRRGSLASPSRITGTYRLSGVVLFGRPIDVIGYHLRHMRQKILLISKNVFEVIFFTALAEISNATERIGRARSVQKVPHRLLIEYGVGSPAVGTSSFMGRCCGNVGQVSIGLHCHVSKRIYIFLSRPFCVETSPCSSKQVCPPVNSPMFSGEAGHEISLGSTFRSVSGRMLWIRVKCSLFRDEQFTVAE